VFLATIIELFVLLFSPPMPSAEPYWQQCELLYDMDERIYGCSMILRQPNLSVGSKSLAYTWRGLAYSEKGDMARAKADFAMAIEGFDEILKSDPANITALMNRGRAHRAGGDLARGIADYDEVIRLEPENADAYNSRCWARVINGVELELARHDCDEAVRLSNRDPNSLDSRAMVSLKLGKFAEARSFYDEALQAWPRTPRFLYGRGVAFLRMGDEAKGRADIDEALKLDPEVGETYRQFDVVP